MGGMEGMAEEEEKEEQEAGGDMVGLVEMVPTAIMHLGLVRTAVEEPMVDVEVTAAMAVMAQWVETLEIQQMEVMLEKLH